MKTRLITPRPTQVVVLELSPQEAANLAYVCRWPNTIIMAVADQLDREIDLETAARFIDEIGLALTISLQRLTPRVMQNLTIEPPEEEEEGPFEEQGDV